MDKRILAIYWSFWLSCVFIVIDLIARFLGWSWTGGRVFVFFEFFWPVLGILTHIWFFLGRSSWLFIALSFFLGLLFEILGLKYGVIFGGRYQYLMDYQTWWDVPFLIPIYWTVFIYTAYSLSESVVFWLKESGSKEDKSFWLILLLSFLDGILTVGLDLLIDPVMVTWGKWKWLDGGGYFGIPLGNFGGWFLVTFISVFLFRLYKKFYPSISPEISGNTRLIPVAGYLTISFAFSLFALNLKLPAVFLIGICLGSLVLVFSSLAFIYKKRI